MSARAIAATACLFLSTVLDPRSDKAHDTHLHLDMLEERRLPLWW